jgi:hypothetical protein
MISRIGILQPHVLTSFTINGSVVPGQPLSLTWGAEGFLESYNLGQVTATISLDNQVLYTSTPIPYITGVFDVVTNALIGGTGPQNVTIDPPQNPAVASSLYKIGAKALTLTLTASQGGSFTDQETLTVVPESVNASWWTWTSPPSDVAWKQAYTPAGTFTNHSQWAAASATLTLYEDENFAEPGKAHDTVTTDAAVPPGTSVDRSFASITQNWSWIVPGAWIVTGPGSKVFVYTAHFTVKDQYGNGYPEVISPMLPVTVTVSGLKIGLGATAQGLVAGALAAAVAAIFDFGVTAAVATALYAGASAAGAGANDPPEPDPNFLERIPLIVPALPQTLSQDNRFTKLIPLLESIDFILAAQDVLSQIQGRLMGARRANNAEGIRLQTASYQETLRGIAAAAARLPNEAAEAVQAINASGLFMSPQFSQALQTWQMTGLPADARQRLHDAGLSDDALLHLQTAIKDERLAMQLHDFAGNLQQVTQALERFSLNLQKQTLVVLA